MSPSKTRVLLATATLLASGFMCSRAFADDLQTPKLSIAPSQTITADADDEAPGLLMTHLDKLGVGSAFKSAGLNVYGWVEAGYTYNHRRHGGDAPILPGPFNHEVGNHFMFNQLDLRLEREVASDKFDVGGLIEVLYGTDAGFTHSSGLGFNGNDPTDDGSPGDRIPDAYRAFYQFDLQQAYIDVNLPIGNGLKLTIGKFITLLGYETVAPIDADGAPTAFYSHSWIFNALPFSQTGVLGTYKLNDQWTFIAGVTRGWDMTLEDNHACQIDGLGEIQYTPSDKITVLLNWNTGPQNFGDTGHYRTVINPIVTWQATDQLKLAAEGLYIYDGGLNAEETDSTHAYGDIWGAAFYASYKLNEYLTLNGRAEKYHGYSDSLGAQGDVSDVLGTDPHVPNTNIYSFTLGLTIMPFPKDPIGMNLAFRPEIRYDYCEDKIFTAGNDVFKDQLTFAADVIFKF